MSIYADLGRLVYRLVKPGFRFLPATRRVRCLLVHESKVLLVKNWLGRRQWTLPGGGAHGSETAQRAIQREMYEELHIRINLKDIRRMGDWEESVDGMRCRFELCTIQLKTDILRRNRLELVACEWFELTELPTNRTAVVDEALRRYPNGS